MECKAGLVVPILKKGDRRLFSITRVSDCPDSLGKVYSRILGKEAQTDYQTSDLGGAVPFLPWQWNSAPALYPCRSFGGVMGV